MKLKLNSIAEEAAACRKAFKKFPIGGFTLHCHHEQVGETLTELAENRITYILSSKPKHERAIRLRLFRPISNIKLKKFKKAYADRLKAYAESTEDESRQAFCDDLNRFLDELSSEDAFGTEGQNDPRGDQRN